MHFQSHKSQLTLQPNQLTNSGTSLLEVKLGFFRVPIPVQLYTEVGMPLTSLMEENMSVVRQ